MCEKSITIRDILTDVDDDILQILEENEITDLKTLKDLINDGEELKSLFPQLRVRLKLKEGIRKYDQVTLETIDDSFGECSPTPVFENSLLNDTAESSITSVSSIRSFVPTQSNIEIIELISEQPPQKRLKEDDFSLLKILENVTTGRAILALYETSRELDSKCQSYLVDIIVQHFMNLKPFTRLTNVDFEKLALSVVELFPTEVKEVYYTPPIKKRFSKDNKAGVARGKLVDKYRNKLTFLRKAKIISSLKSGSDEDEEVDVTVSEGNEDVIWLQNNAEPWADVVEKWMATYKYRQDLIKTDIDLSEILNKFPIIKNSLGHTLIDIDFKQKYPENYQKLFSTFDLKFQKLVDLRRKYLNGSDILLLEILETSDDLAVESRQYLQLSLLAALVPLKSFKRGSKTWVPTLDESKEGILMHVKIPGDVENAVDSKKKKMSKLGYTLQPFIITVGPSYKNITSVYVSFNNILYTVLTILKGIDVCFHLIHILNLKYPYESEHLWMFIQKCFYNLNTKYDNIPNITDLVNRINNKIGQNNL